LVVLTVKGDNFTTSSLVVAAGVAAGGAACWANSVETAKSAHAGAINSGRR
jgi:hypothetical protein